MKPQTVIILVSAIENITSYVYVIKGNGSGSIIPWLFIQWEMFSHDNVVIF